MANDTIVSINSVNSLPTRALNLDPLLSNAFKLVFAKLPNTSLFMQSFDLPGMSIAPVLQQNKYSNIKQIGEKITYLPLDLSFLVNATMDNYKEIVAWMDRITVSDKQQDEIDTATLLINDSITVNFYNIWPTTIGELKFVSNPIDSPYLTCNVGFAYDYWKFA
jgi:hypothetical protein